ncbi:hypothetical protein HMPREF1624_06399 [Sporothrix schenckii ATCC 58251]|uniref:Cupin type-2 domain-containing protein n=1 Tax=Sporothrix schenckii (strain ATCC 58251 / de Perez 2211183) TaxID=1391915 RepID=U7PRH7_SPOS1|nr:hypothetical protein HMPREF1624_06399 [Sporothrix schenckii ATCC 58251]
MAHQGKLRLPKRFITTHNEAGQAVLLKDKDISEDAPFYQLPHVPDVGFAQAYVTRGFPVELGAKDAANASVHDTGADLAVYRDFLQDAPGLTVSGGTVLRYVDMPPGSTSAMHRTVSLDYGVVLEGDVELILDSGETRVMQRGDVCVQRGTMHAWRNLSDTEWGRMLYVLQPCAPFQIGGKDVAEDYGILKGALKNSQ